MSEPGITDAIDEFLAHCAVERNLSRNTLLAYRRDLTAYAIHLAEHGPGAIAGITTEDVAAFVQRRGASGASPASVARTLSTIRGLHRFALRERWVTVDVTDGVRAPARALRLPKAMPIDEVTRLIAAADLSTPLGLRAAALADLLYSTGARISEVLALDVDDIAGDVQVLVVRGKGDRQRLVPLGSMARASVDAYLTRGRPALAVRGVGTPALFLHARGGRLSRQSAAADLEDLRRRAAIPHPVTPHMLRHSFATHLLAGGADIRVVQELLGHASVGTTQIYTKVTVDQLRDVYLRSHPRAVHGSR